MASKTKTVENEQELKALASQLTPMLKPRDVIALHGDLGAGKTSFARSLIQELAQKQEEVPSPTFTLVQTYELPCFTLWHFDLYRLKEEEKDILELGWGDARRDGVILVEWPERLGGLLPKDRLDINISFVKDSDNKREVTLTPQGIWVERLKGL